MAGAFAWFLALPRWLHFALAGALAFGIWLWRHDRAVIENHETKVTAKVQATASAAASEAAAATSQTRNEVERTNDKARQAAAGSDDPLRAGLDRVRQDQRAGKPASR